jgi:glycosyltransferase involved in cell wall biosynthesis
MTATHLATPPDHDAKTVAKRILVVTTVPATMNTFLTPYVEHFHRSGWQVEVATGPGELSERVRRAADVAHEIPWTRNPAALTQVARALRAIRRVIADGRYDIVHVHTPIAAGITRSAVATIRRRRRPAVVYTAHGFHFMPGYSWRRRIAPEVVEWVAGRVTDRLVVINEADRQSATRLGLVKPGCLVSMPGIGLDLGWYEATPELHARAQTVRVDLALADDAVLFTMIAELFPRKGPQDALAAIADMHEPRVHLAFAGTGPYGEELKVMARDLGIGDRVHLL